MTEDQREKWRQALAAKAAQQRRQRWRPPRGIQTVKGAGMVRVLPTRADSADRDDSDDSAPIATAYIQRESDTSTHVNPRGKRDVPAGQSENSAVAHVAVT
jgi:hypothetical protein